MGQPREKKTTRKENDMCAVLITFRFEAALGDLSATTGSPRTSIAA
jgi:hypothetical protein